MCRTQVDSKHAGRPQLADAEVAWLHVAVHLQDGIMLFPCAVTTSGSQRLSQESSAGMPMLLHWQQGAHLQEARGVPSRACGAAPGQTASPLHTSPCKIELSR